MERYKRQISMPQIGAEGQKLLQKSTVAVVGAGGLERLCLLILQQQGLEISVL